MVGGRGSRMGALTETTPKPLLDVGGRPLLCDILGHYVAAGCRRFLLATGHRADRFARFFASGGCRLPDDAAVELVDTGPDLESGARLRALRPRLAATSFMLTWGDGVTDLPLADLLAFHRRHGRLATVTAVRPPARFGYLSLDGERVVEFEEKPEHGPGWINAAWFVFEPGVFDYLGDGNESLERGALVRLARAGELMAYRHAGFWRCMDTPAERDELDRLCRQGRAPWRPAGARAD